jgi:hypothetical protein
MLLSLAAAQSGTEDAEKKAAPAAGAGTPPSAPLIAVYDDLHDVFRLVPRAVVLTPEKYQSLLDEIERLKKQLDRPAARAPSRVHLKGKVDGNLLQLTARFEFDTEKPGESIRLGCGLARATGASLDGRTPRLRGAAPGRARGRDDGEGFVVEVDKPGDHQMTLELVLGVTASPTGHGFLLDLPRAAVTTLELELPPDAREPRLAGSPLAETLLTLKGNQLTGGLGAAEKLDLSWRLANAGGGPAEGAVLAAEGQIAARIDARELVTEAQLTLRVLSGQVKQWRLLVPAKSTLRFLPADEARVARVEPGDPKQLSLRTIHLKEAGAAPLIVFVEHRQPAPKPGSGQAAPVGPFALVGAARQSGSVLVTNNVADQHLEFTPHADLTRRGPTDDELKREPNLAAAFRYGPGGEGGADGKGRGALGGLSWLDVEAETVRGQIKTRSQHLLTLTGDGRDGLRWQVQTTLTVTPRWADVDRLVVQMPAGCEFSEEGSFPLPERVRGVSYDPASRAVEFRLARGGADAAMAPFTVRVEGTFAALVDSKSPGKARLGLPRPAGTIEQDGTVTGQTPAVVELLLPEDDQAPDLELLRQSAHEMAWRYPRRTPDRAELAWQPYRPPIEVRSLADLTLSAAEVKVRHELRYQLPATSVTPRLTLRLPARVAAGLQLREGGRLLGLGPTSGGWQQASVAPQDPRNPVLVLEYTLPLPRRQTGEPAELPLIVPENTTRGEARVRVWGDAGQLPAGAEGWAEQNLEVVPGRDRLPALVLRADRVDQPLALRLAEAEGAAALIDRALVRVEVAANGVQSYRVSYRLLRVAGPALEIELPASAAAVGLKATLDGRQLDPELKGKVIRLRLSPELVRKPAVLEVAYRLDPGRLPSPPLTTAFLAPRLVEDAGGVPTRWLITLPRGQVVLSPEQGPGTPLHWGLRGWLPAPHPGVTSDDLERWFAGQDVSPTEGAASPAPSLVLWHDAAEPIRVTHVPQQAWLLACSLGLVLVGVLAWRLGAAGGGSAAFWLLLFAVAGSAVAAMVFWPALAAQLAYGCQPGLAVLLLLAAAQWLLHERYRRQIIFLPSFSRPRSGSSLTRPEPPPAAPHGEPSTVDAPPRAPGSSINRPA